MKKYRSENAVNISVFSVIFTVISFFITFDTYCKSSVTPETPLLNIAGLPFLRMDFVLLLFSLTFLIGASLITLLKKQAKAFCALALGCLGCISLFIALFDVNTMQIIAPTMRISHVIMTVSRVLAIVLGVSGICAGAALSALLNGKISKTPVLFACLLAIISGVIANAENLQTALYFACAVLLLISSLSMDFSNIPLQAPVKMKFTKNTAVNSIFIISAWTLFGISYSILVKNAGLEEIGFTAVSGLILFVLFLFAGKKQSMLLIGFELLAGSVISYILVHYASQIIAYSGNRVIYVMPYGVGIVCAVICILSAVISQKTERVD